MALTHEEVFERRTQVSSLITQGVNPAEIADHLKVPRHTIYNDMREIRSGRNPELAMRSSNELYAQVLLNQRTRTRVLWNIITRSESEVSQLRALRELRMMDSATLRYTYEMAQAVKVTEEKQRLTEDEAELVKTVSINTMTGQGEVSANQMRKLARLAARLRKLQKITNSTNAQNEVAPTGDGGNLPELYDVPDVTPRRDEDQSTQAG